MELCKDGMRMWVYLDSSKCVTFYDLLPSLRAPLVNLQDVGARQAALTGTRQGLGGGGYAARQTASGEYERA